MKKIYLFFTLYASFLGISFFTLCSCGNKDVEKIVITDKNINEQLSEGFQDVSQKEFNDSIIRSNKIIEFNPNLPEPYFNRGMAKVNSKDIKGGLKDFKKAKELYESQNNKIGYSMVTRAIEFYTPQKKVKKKSIKKEF